MKGTVKFYNKDKGFGFIHTNEHFEDVFFRINDWKNPSMPEGNDEVEFSLTNVQPGKYKGTNIILVKSASVKKQEEKATNFSKNDDREICPGCGKKIVPRLITYQGSVQRSVCPYCATQIKNFGYCFIATAVYEDYDHPQVKALRKFRDEYLLTNEAGKSFVKTYYKYSPKFADYVKGKQVFAYPIKKILDGFVFILKAKDKIKK